MKLGIHRLLRATAIATLIAYLPSCMDFSYAASGAIPLEVSASSSYQFDQNLGLGLPAELGRIESLHPGHKGTILHIQTAHGHYEAQQKIEKILSWLSKKYGSYPILLEGAEGKLDPKLLEFFPNRPEMNLKNARWLAKKALVTGPELYLLQNQKAQGFGIETEAAYRKNQSQFVRVLKSKEAAEKFSELFNREMEKAATLFSPELRSFLKRLEQVELGVVPFESWLPELQKAALKYLKLDLNDAAWQVRWPMLVRLFKIQGLSKGLDAAKYEAEKRNFLEQIKRYVPSHGPRATSQELYWRVELLLNSFGQSIQLPETETENTFIEMLRYLPRDFDFKSYLQVTRFIGTLVLQSELSPSLLGSEIDRLEEIITGHLARNENEKKLIAIFSDYRRLEKLLALQLTPGDFEKIQKRPTTNDQRLTQRQDIKPSEILRRLNAERLTQNAKTVQAASIERQALSELDKVFEEAISFYQGAQERDQVMVRQIEMYLKKQPANFAVVVTGGFHTEPMREQFEKAGYTYAVVTPAISGLDEAGYQAYLKAMVRTSKAHNVQNTAPNQMIELALGLSRLGASTHQEQLRTTAMNVRAGLGLVGRLQDLLDGDPAPDARGGGYSEVSQSLLPEKAVTYPIEPHQTKTLETIGRSEARAWKNPNSQKVLWMGMGFVGATGAVIDATDFGHDVIGVEPVVEKRKKLSRGEPTFTARYFPDLLKKAVRSKRLKFTSNSPKDLAKALLGREFVYLALPTPQSPSGEANIDFLIGAVRDIANAVKPGEKKILIGKSTAPPKTTVDALRQAVHEVLAERRSRGELINDSDIQFAWIPEFLREGTEIEDHRDLSARIVIGAETPEVAERVKALYENFDPKLVPARKRLKIITTDLISAPLVKYAANGWRGAKISFINYISWLTEELGFDINEIADAIGEDPRVVRSFLNCGLGFGGSCFPKDLAAFVKMAKDLDVSPGIVLDALAVNQVQVDRFLHKMISELDGVSGKKIVILGGAFKPETSDTREARSIIIVHELLARGANVVLVDPDEGAISELSREFSDYKGRLTFHTSLDSQAEIFSGASAIALVTEWKQFKAIDFNELKGLFPSGVEPPKIFDGRNALNGTKLRELGFDYFDLGRGKSDKKVVDKKKFVSSVTLLFLALRISYMNTLAEMAEKLGANIDDVRQGFGYDPVVSNVAQGGEIEYLTPGIGWGGYHLPTALDFMAKISKGEGLSSVMDLFEVARETILKGFGIPTDSVRIPFVDTAQAINKRQIQVAIEKIKRELGQSSLVGVKIAVAGLAHKDGANISHSASISLIHALVAEGAEVHAWDPEDAVLTSVQYALKKTEAAKKVIYFRDVHDAMRGTAMQVMAYVTPEFLQLPEKLVKDSEERVVAPLIFDARHIFVDPAVFAKFGATYTAVGMPTLRSEAREPRLTQDGYQVWTIGDIENGFEVTEFGAALVSLKQHGIDQIWQKEQGAKVKQEGNALAVAGSIPLMLPANGRTVNKQMLTPDGTFVDVSSAPWIREAGGHMLHGFTDKLKWQLAELDDQFISLKLRASEVSLNVKGVATLADILGGDVEFTQTYIMENGWLSSSLKIENLSDHEIVLGGGYHPFYQIENLGDWTIQIPASQVWGEGSEPLDLTAQPKEVSGSLDFRTPQPLRYGMEITLGGLAENTAVVLRNTKTGEEKKISFNSKDFPYLLLWVPAKDALEKGVDIFSVEPLLSIPNGRNMFLSGNESAKPLVLASKETRELNWAHQSYARSGAQKAREPNFERRLARAKELLSVPYKDKDGNWLKGNKWIRVSATPKEVANFEKKWKRKGGTPLRVEFEGKAYQISRNAILKMNAWLSGNQEFERKGFFVATADDPESIVDFKPVASYAGDPLMSYGGGFDSATRQAVFSSGLLFYSDVEEALGFRGEADSETLPENAVSYSVHSHPAWSSYSEGPSNGDLGVVADGKVEFVYGLMKKTLVMYAKQGQRQAIYTNKRSEMRKYPRYLETFDPKKSPVMAFANPAANGKLRFDHGSGEVYWHENGTDQKIRYPVSEGDDKRVLWSWQKYFDLARGALVQFGKVGSHRLFGFSLNNLYSNDWFVFFDGATKKLLKRFGEPYQKRVYSMFVVWGDGRVSSEDLVFVPIDSIEPDSAVRVYRRMDQERSTDLSNEIRTAFFGQRIIHQAKDVPVVDFANQIDDLFQLYRFPQMMYPGKKGREAYGFHMGRSELGDWMQNDLARFRKVVGEQGYMEIDLTPYLAEKNISEIESQALTPHRYQRKQPRNESAPLHQDFQPGQYWIVGNKLYIKLMPYPYPHDLVGITHSGKVVPIVFTGDKMQGEGVAIQNLAREVRELDKKHRGAWASFADPLEDVFLLANSGDAFVAGSDTVFKGVRDVAVGIGKTTRDVKAMLVIAKPYSLMEKIGGIFDNWKLARVHAQAESKKKARYETRQVTTFSFEDRQKEWQALGTEDQVYDVAIVGGGATGAAIARDATLRGLKTVLFEKNDFASGTSSRSTKIIHAGIRYLELAWEALLARNWAEASSNFWLVVGAARERKILSKIAPELVQPLHFFIPLYQDGERPPIKVFAGALLYTIISWLTGNGFSKIRFHFSKSARKHFSAMNPESLAGALVYTDALTNDSAWTRAMLYDAHKEGALAFNHAEMVSYEKQSDSGDDYYLVKVRDTFSNQEKTIRARTLVNASGPWIDLTRGQAVQPADKEDRPLVTLSRGIHLDVTGNFISQFPEALFLEKKNAGKKGKIFFVVPRESNGVPYLRIGTTDVNHQNPDEVYPSDVEVKELIEAFQSYFPGIRLTRENILSADAGVRPLVRSSTAPDDPNKASREHRLVATKDGVIHIPGVKLTDARRAGEQVVDLLIQNSLPEHAKKKTVTRTRKLTMPPQVLLPISEASSQPSGIQDWIEDKIQYEMLTTLSDLMFRHEGEKHFKTDAAVLNLATIMQDSLGWSENERNRQIAVFRDEQEKRNLSIESYFSSPAANKVIGHSMARKVAEEISQYLAEANSSAEMEDRYQAIQAAIQLFTLNYEVLASHRKHAPVDQVANHLQQAFLNVFKKSEELILSGKMGGTTIGWSLASRWGILSWRTEEPTHVDEQGQKLVGKSRAEIEAIADAANGLEDIVGRIIRPMAGYWNQTVEVDGKIYEFKDLIKGYVLSAPGWFDDKGELTANQSNIAHMNRGYHFDDPENKFSISAQLLAKHGISLSGRTLHDGTAHAMGEMSLLYGTGSKNFVYLGPGSGMAHRVMVNGESFTGGEEIAYIQNELPNYMFLQERTDSGVTTWNIDWDLGLKISSGTRLAPDVAIRTWENQTAGVAKARRLKEALDSKGLSVLASETNFIGYVINNYPAIYKEVNDQMLREMGHGIVTLIVQSKEKFGDRYPDYRAADFRVVLGGKITNEADLDAVKQGAKEVAETFGVTSDDIDRMFVLSAIPDEVREFLAAISIFDQIGNVRSELRAVPADTEVVVPAVVSVSYRQTLDEARATLLGWLGRIVPKSWLAKIGFAEEALAVKQLTGAPAFAEQTPDVRLSYVERGGKDYSAKMNTEILDLKTQVIVPAEHFEILMRAVGDNALLKFLEVFNSANAKGPVPLIAFDETGTLLARISTKLQSGSPKAKALEKQLAKVVEIVTVGQGETAVAIQNYKPEEKDVTVAVLLPSAEWMDKMAVSDEQLVVAMQEVFKAGDAAALAAFVQIMKEAASISDREALMRFLNSKLKGLTQKGMGWVISSLETLFTELANHELVAVSA